MASLFYVNYRLTANSAQSLSAAMATGCLYQAKDEHFVTSGDIFYLNSDDDLYGTPLSSAKGSAIGQGDLFQITNIAPSTAAVVYISSLLNDHVDDNIGLLPNGLVLPYNTLETPSDYLPNYKFYLPRPIDNLKVVFNGIVGGLGKELYLCVSDTDPTLLESTILSARSGTNDISIFSGSPVTGTSALIDFAQFSNAIAGKEIIFRCRLTYGSPYENTFNYYTGDIERNTVFHLGTTSPGLVTQVSGTGISRFLINPYTGSITIEDWNDGDYNDYTGTITDPILSAIGTNEDPSQNYLPITACECKSDYIELYGQKNNARYGSCRNINLKEYLPQYLQGGDTEKFLLFFEDYLNEMFSGLCGFQVSGTELNINKNYQTAVGASSALTDDYARNFSYNFSATSAENAPTEANEVSAISIISPNNSIDIDPRISILEKINRITELHDPDLIDIEYIQHFASNLGYNIDIYRNEVGISGTGTLGFGDFGEDSSLATDSEKYLRLMISNLPNWYKIKSTNNAIKVMLYSFGLIGDIVEYYSNNYLPVAEGGLWRLNANHDITEIPETWFPTPHFTILIRIDDSTDISFDMARRQKIIRAIESIRPVNTVFRKLSAYLKRTFEMKIVAFMRFTRYIQIKSDGWTNAWSGTPPAYPS